MHFYNGATPRVHALSTLLTDGNNYCMSSIFLNLVTLTNFHNTGTPLIYIYKKWISFIKHLTVPVTAAHH